MTDTGRGERDAEFRFSPLLLMAIALLSASAPFAIDMHLPALPVIAADLGTSESLVQLTLSGFVLGLGVGQLIVGPLSDAVGRKWLMVAGAVVAFGAAVVAAFAPSIGVLIGARVVQGLGSGACLVVSRAVIPDLASGRRASQAFATMMSIQTLAPVVAPLAGGILLDPLGWRGLFWVLAGIAAAQLGAAAWVIPESRPRHLRSRVSVSAVAANYRYVLADAGYRGYLCAVIFTFATLFSYISASPFFFQNELGYSPRAFSLLFALNATALLAGNIVNARLQVRFDPRGIMRVAVVIYGAAAAGVLVAVLVSAPDWVIFALLVAVMSQQGLIQPNAMSLGQLQVRSRAGGASALMGFFQFSSAALVSPLMGLGDSAGVAMASGMLVFSLVAGVSVFYATSRPGPRAADR